MAVLLFDLDGTLADTNPDLHAAMNHILGQHGLTPLPQDRVRHLIGGGAAMILQRGFAEHGITLSKADMAAAEEFVLGTTGTLTTARAFLTISCQYSIARATKYQNGRGHQ